MKAQRSGRIVTVASCAGKIAGIGGGYARYGAAKAAIAHYTRYLAQELGPFGINANSPTHCSTRTAKDSSGSVRPIRRTTALGSPAMEFTLAKMHLAAFPAGLDDPGMTDALAAIGG